MCEVLDGEWVWFQRVMIDSDVMLQKNKEKFKNSLVLSSHELKKKIQTTFEEFNITGLHVSLFGFPQLSSLMCYRGGLYGLNQYVILHNRNVLKIQSTAAVPNFFALQILLNLTSSSIPVPNPSLCHIIDKANLLLSTNSMKAWKISSLHVLQRENVQYIFFCQNGHFEHQALNFSHSGDFLGTNLCPFYTNSWW